MLMEGQDELGVAEAARFLDRSTEQVRRYLRESRLKGRRIGGQWFIRKSDLERFRDALREQHSFLEKLRPAAELNPLESVIGIGAGGGSNIGDGKDAYRRAFWWRR
jgi:excisionase family DNA binding protein